MIIEIGNDIESFQFYEETIKKSKVSIVLFTSKKCPYCKQLIEIIKEISGDKRYKRFKIIILNNKNNKNLFKKFVIKENGNAKFFKIKDVPAMFFFIHGKCIKINNEYFIVGLHSKQVYIHIFNNIYEAYKKIV